MEQEAETVELGRTGLRVSALGVGTNTWGSRAGPDPDKRATLDAALDSGITLLDTAEVYGASEQTIGRCIRESGRRPAALTKFAPLPWRLGKGAGDVGGCACRRRGGRSHARGGHFQLQSGADPTSTRGPGGPRHPAGMQ